jgi:hypothetical protein
VIDINIHDVAHDVGKENVRPEFGKTKYSARLSNKNSKDKKTNK